MDLLFEFEGAPCDRGRRLIAEKPSREPRHACDGRHMLECVESHREQRHRARSILPRAVNLPLSQAAQSCRVVLKHERGIEHGQPAAASDRPRLINKSSS